MSTDTKSGFHVLIPAAGNGSRAGAALPKQYVRVGGKTILRHTIEKFIALSGLKSLRVIIDPSHIDLYLDSVSGLDLPPPVHGGTTRQESVYNGLCALNDAQDDIVLIHDAARPFVQTESILKILDVMNETDAATLIIPMADTLVDADYRAHDRNKIFGVQTPQAFKFSFIKSAHEMEMEDETFTDDAGLVSAMGKKITLVNGTRDNFKITTNEDLIMAEKLFSSNFETRTAMGYDIHAFDPAPSDKVILGGIEIPHTRRLMGHSDADVVLHALTDAILGTIAGGDIGQLFPPTDMQWKGADSTIFVTEALRRLHAKGGRVLHADITILAEEPKIGPHRDKMAARIADILGLDPSRIGLKATTMEGLGAIGRREGIAAHVLVTVTIPPNHEIILS